MLEYLECWDFSNFRCQHIEVQDRVLGCQFFSCQNYKMSGFHEVKIVKKPEFQEIRISRCRAVRISEFQVHVQIVSAQIVSAQFVSAQIVSAQIVSGTNCIRNKLYREHIVSGTNCIL
jgi:hypothetical protein